MGAPHAKGITCKGTHVLLFDELGQVAAGRSGLTYPGGGYKSRFFWTGNMRRAVLPVGVTRTEVLRKFGTLHLVTSNFF